MPRPRKADSADDSAPPRAGRPWLVQFVLPLLGAAALLGLVLLAGRYASEALRDRGRTVISFADIDCESPPGVPRRQFLDEVQYVSSMPDELDLLDADLAARVAEAFATHPWVARVERVARRGDGVSVDLVWRVPLLAIEEPARVVDAGGVLLPVGAKREGLPRLTTRVRSPAGVPGQAWGDDRVRLAARVVVSARTVMELKGWLIEVEEGEVTLSTPQRRIWWGKPDGTLDKKRLLRLQQMKAADEIDLRMP